MESDDEVSSCDQDENNNVRNRVNYKVSLDFFILLQWKVIDFLSFDQLPDLSSSESDDSLMDEDFKYKVRI